MRAGADAVAAAWWLVTVAGLVAGAGVTCSPAADALVIQAQHRRDDVRLLALQRAHALIEGVRLIAASVCQGGFCAGELFKTSGPAVTL